MHQSPANAYSTLLMDCDNDWLPAIWVTSKQLPLSHWAWIIFISNVALNLRHHLIIFSLVVQVISSSQNYGTNQIYTYKNIEVKLIFHFYFRSDIPNLKFNFTVQLPKLTFTGKYSLKMRLLLLNIQGKGPISGTLGKILTRSLQQQ